MIETHKETFVDSYKRLDKLIEFKEWEEYSIAKGVITDQYFFSDRSYIDKFVYGFDPRNAESIPTGLLDANNVQIYVKYQEEPYYVASIRLPIAIFNFNNLYSMIIKYLADFMKINGFKSKYLLEAVLSSALAQLKMQKDLEIRLEDREKLIRLSQSAVVKRLKIYKDLTTLDRIEAFGLFREANYYAPYIEGYMHIELIGAAINNRKKYKNIGLINACINNMKDASMFISPETIGDQLYTTGHNQIRSVYNNRRKELRKYNIDNFSCNTYYQWKKKHW